MAKSLQYPGTGVELIGPAWPWALTLRAILITVAAGSAAALTLHGLRRRREILQS